MKQVQCIKVLKRKILGVFQVWLSHLKDKHWKPSGNSCRWGRHLSLIHFLLSHRPWTYPCNALDCRSKEWGQLPPWCSQGTSRVTVTVPPSHWEGVKGGSRALPPWWPVQPSLQETALLPKVTEERCPSLWNGQEIILELFPRTTSSEQTRACTWKEELRALAIPGSQGSLAAPEELGDPGQWANPKTGRDSLAPPSGCCGPLRGKGKDIPSSHLGVLIIVSGAIFF